MARVLVAPRVGKSCSHLPNSVTIETPPDSLLALLLGFARNLDSDFIENFFVKIVRFVWIS